MEIDFSAITDVQFEDIDHSDYPDYCDAYIASCLYKGVPATQEEIEAINDNGEFVHEKLWDYLF
jgi:hypothetical protein